MTNFPSQANDNRTANVVSVCKIVSHQIIVSRNVDSQHNRINNGVKFAP